MKRCRPDLLERQHGRDVERLLQRAPHRDRAVMVAVEVARQPVPEAHRHVLDQRLRMERAVVEGQGVDQRLQRRAGRAVRAHQVDLAGAAEIVAAAQPGHDAAGAIVHHDHRDLRLVGELAALLGDELAEARLQLEARSSSERSRRATGRPARPRGAARAWAWRGLRSGTGPADRHVVQHLVDDARAPARAPARHRVRPAPTAGALGPAALGRLRNGDQQGGLGGGELLGLLAEIGEGGGAHAFEVAAHRRQGQVDRHHLALGVAPFELQCARRLDRLGQKPRGRGSSSRAACMEIVEAPDTMRPRAIHCPAARAAASGSMPQ